MALTQVSSDVLNSTQGNLNLVSVGVSGNLTFTGNGSRILGDFSNSTYLSRTAIQSAEANTNTALSILPNGDGVSSRIDLYSNADPTTSSYLAIEAAPSHFRLTASYNGPQDDSKYMPISIYTSTLERLIVDTNGNVGIGTSSPTEKLHIDGKLKVTGNVTAPNFSGTANNASYLGGAPAEACQLGYGQTWQLPSRAAGTTYTNSTNKPIMVVITVNPSTAPNILVVVVGGVTIYATGSNTWDNSAQATFIVPIGSTYSITTSSSVRTWAELR